MPETKEQWDRRMYRWQHNGHFGRVAMARSGMQSIQNSTTTTEPTKQLAASIEADLMRLAEHLKTRIDQ